MRIKGCCSHSSYKCNKQNIKMKRFLTRGYDFIKKFDYRIINTLKMYQRKMIKLSILSILMAVFKRSFFFINFIRVLYNL